MSSAAMPRCSSKILGLMLFSSLASWTSYYKSFLLSGATSIPFRLPSGCASSLSKSERLLISTPISEQAACSADWKDAVLFPYPHCLAAIAKPPLAFALAQSTSTTPVRGVSLVITFSSLFLTLQVKFQIKSLWSKVFAYNIICFYNIFCLLCLPICFEAYSQEDEIQSN